MPKKTLERLLHELLLDAGEVHLDDRLHRLACRGTDVVEEAAAQERVRQLLLVVGGDEDEGPVPGRHGLPVS
jgi:hypothetical protein